MNYSTRKATQQFTLGTKLKLQHSTLRTWFHEVAHRRRQGQPREGEGQESRLTFELTNVEA